MTMLIELTSFVYVFSADEPEFNREKIVIGVEHIRSMQESTVTDPSGNEILSTRIVLGLEMAFEVDETISEIVNKIQHGPWVLNV